MHPVLFTIGPVSFKGFLIFTVSILAVWVVVNALKTVKKEIKNDILMFALVLSAAALILMLGKWRLPIRSYGVMTATGFIMATWFTARQGQKAGIPSGTVLDAGVIALIFGIIGARLYHVIVVDPLYYLHDLKKIFSIWEGGQVLYGGVILGGIALFIYLKKKKVPILKFFDLTAMAVLIGIGFGRIGCFLAGCCYGIQSASLGLRFPQESLVWFDQCNTGLIVNSAEHSLPVLPTQIFSSLGSFLLFGLIFLFYRKAAKFDGHTLCVMLISYSIFRFFIEMIRELPRYAGFTAAQWTSMATLIFAVILLVVLRKKNASI